MALAIWTLAVPVAGLGALLDRAATSANVLWGYNRAAALSAATASAAWGVTLALGSFPRRAAARRLGHVALALTLAVVVAASRPADPPIVAPTEGVAAQAASATSPPVILITMDTTRADHLSVYGYPRDTTPALRRLARDGVVHANVLSTSSWTLPAHASLFTGLMPSRHRADRLQADAAGGAGDRVPRTRPLDPDQLTLAEWLAGRGYRTGAVSANFAYLSHAFGLDQGFQFSESRPNSGTAFVLLDVIDRRLVVLPWLRRALLPYRPARVISRRALAWVRTVQHVPFFLFVNYMEPHTPNVAGLRYAQFAGDDLGERIAVAPAGRAAVDLYDSEIASMDAAIGELLDGLRRLGVFDCSLIVVTADHGESLGEHGTWGHGSTLNQPELRVPLIVKYPWSAWRGRRRGTASIVDVVPTIGREVHAAFPRPVDGRPLRGRHRLAVAELHGWPSGARPGRGSHDVTVVDHLRKLVWTSDGPVRVYDLATDPGELRDVASLHRRWARHRVDGIRPVRAASTGGGT
jgi:arylsulfatase A-like enzyme